ncbi:MAG: hypothetical protein ACK5T0_05415 [Vampirovibrionales bacterium]
MGFPVKGLSILTVATVLGIGLQHAGIPRKVLKHLHPPHSQNPITCMAKIADNPNAIEQPFAQYVKGDTFKKLSVDGTPDLYQVTGDFGKNKTEICQTLKSKIEKP